ncbi:response regulator receiver sensor signal transduction histidine kinase [Gloeocapsa sp. PCC 7428]|uniref:ATP-binding response regulator n=1 Tax=Gloeocapsa sp. PCC 7428 TaxID=1173026 RepID=UPI0002A5DF27|nr:ATP-binding protein [Gloeocapsa sp. PCC 7428]AFZ31582.1 response regulator receiver sensor signal transduction histidine kinase [Gloeocapsa sp. PCC 7428]
MVQRRTIVIIDDCQEDRDTYRRYLLKDETYKYDIIGEEYGEDGLELCNSVQPDVILLDFLLPDINGLEFLSQLQLQTGKTNLPVIMLTGQGNEAIAVQAMKSGASDYLVKGETTAESLRIAIHNAIKRTHLQNLLAQSEQRFQTSVETMLDCFGICNSIRDHTGEIIDFTIEYVNAAACAFNRMNASEQIGASLLKLPLFSQAGLFDEMCQVVKTGKPLAKEVLLYADDNQPQIRKALDIRVTQLGDGFAIAWRDITDRKCLEEERAQLLIQEQLARSAAEAANHSKDVFLAMVSHELRNPLTAILMYAQLLQAQKLKEEQISRAYETIERNVRLQKQLIDDLLDVSRIVSGKLHLNMQCVDLVVILQAAIDTVHPLAEAKAIQLELAIAPHQNRHDVATPSVIFFGDATRLQQVFWNLLSNAIKFTPHQGRVQAKLEYSDRAIQITVSDTGQGISPDFLPHVFERFRQADTTRHGGLGLGLAIVNHIVQLHGGFVKVESPGVDQGATFTIEFPKTSTTQTQITSNCLSII